MTNKPKSRRSKNAVHAQNGAFAPADSNHGLNAHAVTSAQASIFLAEGPLTNSISTTPVIDDKHGTDPGPGHQSAAETSAQSIASGTAGHATFLPIEHVTNLEAPKIKIALTNKQLKKKARRRKQAQKAKMAPGPILNDESGVPGASTKAISHSRKPSMPTISECSTSSENKVSSETEIGRPSKPSVTDSSLNHCGQLLAQQMEFGQPIEPADMEFDAHMGELKQQGTAAEAKYAGLMLGIRQWADARAIPADANAPMPKFIDDAATPILQRKFSFIEGKPDIADIRPILKDSSELLEYKRSKGKIRYVSSSDNTLVDGDTLLDTGNSRNLGADFAEPFWRAEMPERPRQPTPLLHEEEESSSHDGADAKSSECKQNVKRLHNIAGNERLMQKQEGSSRPSGNEKALVADFDYGGCNEEDAVDDEEDYSGDDYGVETGNEEISDELAMVLELQGKWLEAFVHKKREEMGVLQDRYLSQRGYVKRRGAGRR